jgi:hypothetical protein
MHHPVFGVEADIEVPDGQDGVGGTVQPGDVQALHG